MRSRNSSPSRITVKAGKLAKPRVAMATPATFTAMKKLTQCPASNTPPSARRCQSRACRGCQAWRATPANTPRASTAKAARPKTMIAGAALASLPNTPVRPKNNAPMCRAPRAVRWFMVVLVVGQGSGVSLRAGRCHCLSRSSRQLSAESRRRAPGERPKALSMAAAKALCEL
ncbi:hypothetical protein D3C79_848570 [compost metagenome]